MNFLKIASSSSSFVYVSEKALLTIARVY